MAWRSRPLDSLLVVLAVAGCSSSGGEAVGEPDAGTVADGEPGETEDSRLSIDPVDDDLSLRQGGAVAIDLTIVSRPETGGPVHVSVPELPEGLTAKAVEAETYEDLVTVELKAVQTATVGAYTLEIEASAGEETAVADIDVEVAWRRGALDAEFGSDGLVVAPPELADARARRVIRRDDGTILVVGANEDGDVFVARHLPSGELDPDFGTDGVAWARVDLSDYRYIDPAYVATREGRIAVALSAQTNADSLDDDLVVVGLTESGTLDADVGDQGVAVHPLGSLPIYIRGFEILADGRMVAVLSLRVGGFNSQTDLLVTRLAADGTLDPSFGDGGEFQHDFDEYDTFAGPAVMEDGSYVLAGVTSPCALICDDTARVVRVAEDGSGFVDFGDADGTEAYVGTGFAELLRTAAGDFIAVGASIDYPAVWRMLPTGELDPDFGIDGLEVMRLDDDDERGDFIAAVPDEGGAYDAVGTVWHTYSEAEGVVLARVSATDLEDRETGGIPIDLGDEAVAADAVASSGGRVLILANAPNGDEGRRYVLAQLWR